MLAAAWLSFSMSWCALLQKHAHAHKHTSTAIVVHGMTDTCKRARTDSLQWQIPLACTPTGRSPQGHRVHGRLTGAVRQARTGGQGHPEPQLPRLPHGGLP